MKVRLGYVAISKTIEDISYCHNLTFTNYKKLNVDSQNEKLNNIIKKNLVNLKEILKYNGINNIHFFRLSHSMIPLATHEKVIFDYIRPFKKEWLDIENIIKKFKMRIDIHPDQFCVLNSDKKDVVNNSMKILKFNNEIFNILNINGKIIIHVGSSIPNKIEAIERFKKNFLKLDRQIQKQIIIENDDKIYNVIDVLNLCEELKTPMVLDYHHYICNNNKENIDDYFERIFSTWDKEKLPPKIHFSSPKNRKNRRAHSEFIDYKAFINFINRIKKYNKNIDIMLECKGKDEALFKLVRQLKYYTNFKFIDDTTFEV